MFAVSVTAGLVAARRDVELENLMSLWCDVISGIRCLLGFRDWLLVCFVFAVLATAGWVVARREVEFKICCQVDVVSGVWSLLGF